jgi:hypothetical protein
MAALIDEAMNTLGGKEWHYETRSEPCCAFKKIEDIGKPLTVQELLTCCRPPTGVKSTMMLLDVHLSVQLSESPEAIASTLQSQQVDDLPAPLKFKERVPSGAKIGGIVIEQAPGCLNVIKLVFFKATMSTGQATKIASGSAYLPFFRAGPWAVKKAFQSLLDRVPGHHVQWNVVCQKEKVAKPASSSSTWSPDEDVLRQGVAFINENAPESDAQNEQYTWILLNIKEDSESPIAGWPETKVRLMAQNKSRASSGATLQREFPLTTFSLKPFLAEALLPLLYPLFICYGVLCIGWPGVGKTPALISMLLAMGRYHIHRLQADGVPGWRRAKSLDNFRHQIGQVYEGIFLDDPHRDSISIADLKSFLTVEEEQTTSGRYNDAKLIRNCMRAYASNDLDRSDEPEDDNRTSITGEEFLKLTRRIFAGDKHADVLACLKRAVVIILGLHAVYLRLPSQDPTSKVHRIKVDDLHRDLLAEKDKPLYSKYKLGILEYGPEWEGETEQEVRMISEGLERFAAGRPEAYIEVVNGKIEEQLWSHLPPVPPVHLPDRPSGASSDSGDDQVMPPPSIIVPDPKKRCNRLGTFTYPPTKRYKTKSSQEESHHPSASVGVEDTDAAAALASLEANAQDAEEALQMPEDLGEDLAEEDFAADEEAAAVMRGA